ncbi:MAG: TetR/AcrR family transcriptional regulator [Saccharospirillaceae bacterium]|nr:TetR/AcrR family transcriptional regulator [Saccharospirillaceae bacterium]MCD8529815.1 TetR/AcrR family transcriptional regulator [Saccharospirillaceae bacterium]
MTDASATSFAFSSVPAKQQQLIQTAFTLFYRDSIHGVGINQILQETGIAKKTLYHHFASKDELILAVLAYRDEVFFNWYEQRIRHATSAEETVQFWFSALDDWFHNRVAELQEFRGCFFMHSAAEFTDPAHPVHQHCAQHKTRLSGMLSKHLGQWLDSRKAKKLADDLCLLKEGAIVCAQVQGNKKAARQAALIAQGLLITAH